MTTLDDHIESIRKALKQYRGEKNQYDLANELGVTQSSISRAENEGNIQLELLLALSQKDPEAFNKIMGWETNNRNQEVGKKDSADGVTWIEYIPVYLNEGQKIEAEKAIRIFRMAVKDSMTESQIALELNDSWDKLGPLLTSTFRNRFIQIVDVQPNDDLATEVKDKFNLKEVFVANVTHPMVMLRAEEIAFIAATKVLDNIPNNTNVGIGDGYTILRMAELSTGSNKVNNIWLPLVKYINDKVSHIPQYSSTYITELLRRKNPNSQIYKFNADEFNQSLESCNTMIATVNHWRRTSTTEKNAEASAFRSSDYTAQSRIFTKIFFEDFKRLGIQDQFGGEFLGRILDKNGKEMGLDDNIVKNKLKKYVKIINLSRFYHAVAINRLWIIAGGLYKAEAVLMAIKAGLTNALVIDREIAEYLKNN